MKKISMKKTNFFETLRKIVAQYSKSDRFYFNIQAYYDLCETQDKANLLKKINAVYTTTDKAFLNFENELVLSIKKSNDIYNLYNLHESDTKSILAIKNDLKKITKNRLQAVLLVGSYARNTASEKSDYDFLVVSNEKIKYKKIISGKKIEVISYQTDEFIKSLLKEDEFILWGLKYGLILYDNEFLSSFFPLKDTNFIKLKHRKKELLERLVYRAGLSIGIDKTNVTSMRLNELKTQLMRSSIIALNYHPKSSPELSNQFKTYIDNPKITKGIIEITTGRNSTKQQLQESFEKLKTFYFEWLRKQL